jgi:hypothetical protein
VALCGAPEAVAQARTVMKTPTKIRFKFASDGSAAH